MEQLTSLYPTVSIIPVADKVFPNAYNLGQDLEHPGKAGGYGQRPTSLSGKGFPWVSHVFTTGQPIHI